MSEMATRRLAISRPLGCRMLSEMPRLPEFLLLYWPPISESVTPASGALADLRASRPPTGAIAARRVSGFSFHSTLMLSAPNDAAKRVPPAEARNQEKSRMRTFCRAKGRPRADIAGRAEPGLETVGFATLVLSVRFKTSSVSSPMSGARRPGCHRVSELNHLLVG